jgi:hypothetical protein
MQGPENANANLISVFAIPFCWAVAVLLVRRSLMPKVSREPEIESQI